jgi:hypothetical protein
MCTALLDPVRKEPRRPRHSDAGYKGRACRSSGPHPNRGRGGSGGEVEAAEVTVWLTSSLPMN